MILKIHYINRNFARKKVADKYPSARVIGVDLSNIMPRFVPTNVEFRMDDIESEWATLYSNLDLVHFRSVVQTLRNPDRVLAMAFQFGSSLSLLYTLHPLPQ